MRYTPETDLNGSFNRENCDGLVDGVGYPISDKPIE
jgi:hypothetical protein